MKTPGATDRRRQWWTAIAGSVGFCLVGLAFVPGLVSQQPTPAPAAVAEEAPITLPATALLPYW